jgi:hypothetical protein
MSEPMKQDNTGAWLWVLVAVLFVVAIAVRSGCSSGTGGRYQDADTDFFVPH